MSKVTHTHVDEYGNVTTHTHEMTHEHGHYHSPEEKKKQINRLARAIGHLQHVKVMIENDEDCADVLMQLSAVNSALKNLGKEIINEHMTHCITHAIEDGDTHAVEEFQKAVQKFI
ncbi:MAG: metal-sensing transcriptional repressor [Clostridia bacterium]|nr:metal-sensing transcriptional repressor [Clostridia bacterium]